MTIAETYPPVPAFLLDRWTPEPRKSRIKTMIERVTGNVFWLRRPKPEVIHSLAAVDDILENQMKQVVLDEYAPKEPTIFSDQYVRGLKSMTGDQPLDMMAQLIVNLTYKDMMKLGEEVTKSGIKTASSAEAAASLHKWAESRLNQEAPK